MRKQGHEYVSKTNLHGWAPLLLSGCLSLDPLYTRPTAPVPDSLPKGGAYASLGHAPGSNYRDIDWRDYILDVRLRQSVAMALDSSRDLREAVADVKAAKAQYAKNDRTCSPLLMRNCRGPVPAR